MVEGVNITLCSSGHTLGSRPEQHHCLNVWKSNAHIKLMLVDNHHYHQYLHPPHVIMIMIIITIIIMIMIIIILITCGG